MAHLQDITTRLLAVALSTSLLTPQTAIPPGTAVVVRTIDAIDSKVADPGKTYNASLDEPLIIDSREVAPKGAKAVLKVIEVTDAGKIRGKAALSLVLTAIESGGASIPVNTASVSSESSGKGKSTAKRTGIFAGIGTAVGAVAGGGKGAAIGAAAGAGAGLGVSVLSPGPKVNIPAETRLTFVTK